MKIIQDVWAVWNMMRNQYDITNKFGVILQTCDTLDDVYDFIGNNKSLFLVGVSNYNTY